MFTQQRSAERPSTNSEFDACQFDACRFSVAETGRVAPARIVTENQNNVCTGRISGVCTIRAPLLRRHRMAEGKTGEDPRDQCGVSNAMVQMV